MYRVGTRGTTFRDEEVEESEMMLSTKSSWHVKFGLLRVILTSVDESVVVLGVRSSSIVGFLELDGANTGGLAVSTVAHGHLAEGANCSGKKFL